MNKKIDKTVTEYLRFYCDSSITYMSIGFRLGINNLLTMEFIHTITVRIEMLYLMNRGPNDL